MTPSKDLSLPPVPKTTEGLRDALFDEINALRAGTTTPQRSKAIAHMAARIIDSVRIQVQFQKLVASNGAKNVSLGSVIEGEVVP